MKIFLDTADRVALKKWAVTGIIDGVTTNPSNLSKEGGDPRQVLTDICALFPEGDISIEVVEKDPKAVYEQALAISKFAPNITVKIPFVENLLPVIDRLCREGIAVNVTLIFSVLQALLVAKMGVSYISPFVGRWDDIDVDGIILIEQLMQLKTNYDFESEILVASIRNLTHWNKAALAGADVATVGPALLEQLMHHPLTERGLAGFDTDWKKLGNIKFIE